MRTGCYALFSGYFTGPVGGGGKLTALYYRLEDVAGSLLKLLPNQRLKLPASGAHICRIESVLSVAAAGRSLGAIR